MRSSYEVADVLSANWSWVEQTSVFNSYQIRILRAIKSCRTLSLGGHIDACTSCGCVRISYNSCRNRHCPKCQGSKREQWINKREEELLGVPYFHVVFTLPSVLNQYAITHPREVYGSLFNAAWNTVKTFGNDPRHLGAKTGMICILHTWGQNLSLHPHLHCIIPGGGITESGKWKDAKSKGKYLFPVRAMSEVYRGKYMALIKRKIPEITNDTVTQCYKKHWVVYAKRPFGHPRHVVEYLGRYSHKVAISNNRIRSIEGDMIRFTAKTYKKGGTKTELQLTQKEFIRRFSLHILPKRFVRIRHYGILSSTSKAETINQMGIQLSAKTECAEQEPRILKTYDHAVCPHCQMSTMITIGVFSGRGPPLGYLLSEVKQKKTKGF